QTPVLQMSYFVDDDEIMGMSQVTVEKMVAYFEASGKPYPVFYSSLGIDLKELAQIYYDISQKEGVRAEIAWVQMCYETGYLQFGGAVRLEQFNFGGLGATGNGAEGYDFSAEYGADANGIRFGVAGHVQHLKCYASIDEVIYTKSTDKNSPDYNEPIDPRWSDALRGTAKTLEELSGKWAVGMDYGEVLSSQMFKIIAI
ncbi:MAG: glucosaminidase domain-containing protein, partial [Anaerovoracaceae bacterium]